jgi:predicted nucleotide-binding protein
MYRHPNPRLQRPILSLQQEGHQMLGVDYLRSKRFELMQKLYELSQGNEYQGIDEQILRAKLDLSQSTMDRVAEYLVGEGLARYFTFGTISITHKGVREVEEALSQPGKPTEHFPALMPVRSVHVINSGLHQEDAGRTQIPISGLLQHDEVSVPKKEATLGESSTHNNPNHRNPRDVFVVHGRNSMARDALFEFLRALDLRPIEWEEAARATRPRQHILDIVETGASMAQAIVVLLTPDDEARLREPLWARPNEEPELRGQPRPNVLFEAGWALAKHNDRTIIVELGELRGLSDISGVYTIRNLDSADKRNELANRLEQCGCPVKRSGGDWLRVGDFSKAIQLRKRRAPGNAATNTQSNSSSLGTSPAPGRPSLYASGTIKRPASLDKKPSR